MALTKYTASTAIIAALADLPNATDGLTAAQLKAKFDENPEAFKTFVNTLIDQLESTTDSSSGADQIGATSITDLTGNTVQALLESLKALVDTQLPTPDGSITNTKLATDVKVGSLAALTTTDKSSVVAGVNEHLDDGVAQGVHGMGLAAAQDYEEGTWTPSYSPASGAFDSIAYSSATGSYIKVGKLIYISGLIATSSVTIGTASGNLIISGIPFTPKSGAFPTASLGACYRFSFITVPNQVFASIESTGITVAVSAFNDITNINITVSDLTTGAASFSNQIKFSGIFQIA